MAYHDGIGSGQLLSRAVSDLSTIRMFLSFGAIFLVVNSLTFLIGLGILFSLSWLLALVVLAQAIPLIVICARYETHYKVLARRSQDQVGDVATTVEESILGVRILKSFGRSAHLGPGVLPAGQRATRHRDRQGPDDREAVGDDHRAARDRPRASACSWGSSRSPTARCRPAPWWPSSPSR